MERWRRRGGSGGWSAPTASRSGEQGAQRGGRFFAQLLFQQSLQLLVVAQRGSGLSRGSQQAKEMLVRGFIERFEGHGATGVSESAREVPACLILSDELGDRFEEQPGQMLLGGRDPLFVEARQQATLIKSDRLGQTLGLLCGAPCQRAALRAASNWATSVVTAAGLSPTEKRSARRMALAGVPGGSS